VRFTNDQYNNTSTCTVLSLSGVTIGSVLSFGTAAADCVVYKNVLPLSSIRDNYSYQRNLIPRLPLLLHSTSIIITGQQVLVACTYSTTVPSYNKSTSAGVVSGMHSSEHPRSSRDFYLASSSIVGVLVEWTLTCNRISNT
jgi:hypothetical protein